MRVAVVQFAPKIGQVQDNVATARRLCEKLGPRSVDLVCLPEMIFTGYVFPNAVAISPYLEEPVVGPTSRFCADLAARLQCYVAAGYPERLEPHEIECDTLADGTEVERIGANSAVLYGPGGELVGRYRKTNLYETDMTWAKPGTGFVTFDLPPPLNTVSLGICMDLNAQSPARWTLEEGPYEIADYCVAQKSNILILLNAWLDTGAEQHQDKDWQTLNYWASRLRPLWANAVDEPKYAKGSVPSPHNTKDRTFVVICNRCGEENGKTFAGSSSLFQMKQGSGRPKLLTSMGRREEGIAIWNIASSS